MKFLLLQPRPRDLSREGEAAAGTTRLHETRRRRGRCASRYDDIPEHPCMLVGPTRGPRIPRRPPFNGRDCASTPTTGAARRASTRLAGPARRAGWLTACIWQLPALSRSSLAGHSRPLERAGSRPPAARPRTPVPRVIGTRPRKSAVL